MTVHIFKGDGRQPWFVRVVSANGQVLSISEGYATKWGARRAAKKFYPHLTIKEIA